MNVDSRLNRITQVFLCIFVAASPFSIAITQTALFLGVVFWIVMMVKQGKSLIPRTPFDYYFLAYILIEIISSIFSINREMAVINLKRMFLIPIVYFVAANVKDKKFLGVVLTCLISVMAILSIIGIVKYLSGQGGLAGRLSLYHHYMTSGGILMIVSLITFSIAFSSTVPKIRIITLSCGTLMIIPLLLTFTRSSWLGFMAGMSIILILWNRKSIIGLIAITVLFLIFAPNSLKSRAFSIFNLKDPTNAERLYMWQAGIKIIKDHPLTGVGDIDLGEIYEEYKSPNAKERVGHLHNNIFMLGATIGIPGLMILLALFLRIIITEIKIFLSVPQKEWLLKGTALGSIAVFVGFQINGLFEWNFGDSEIAMLLWMTAGLSLAVERLYKMIVLD